MSKFGIICALVTPFMEHGDKVDEVALRSLVDQMVADGVDGLLPSGGTGEFTSLSDGERRDIIRIVAEQADGRVPVIAHTGAASTRAAIELTSYAAGLGVDAALLAVPYYEAIGEDAAIRYYSEISKAVDIPLVAYNHPAATGLTMTPDFLSRLIEAAPNMSAVKDSSSDVRHMHALTSRPLAGIAFLTGVDMLLGPALTCGAKGAIMGGTNILAPIYAQMWAAAEASDHAAVNELWLKILPITTFIETYPYTASVKAGCAILGRPVGEVRSPAEPLSADGVKLLEKLLEDVYA